MTESVGIRNTRRWIIILVALIVSGLGYPLFLFTTTVFRADLPIEEIQELSNSWQHDIHFKIPIYLEVPTTLVDLVSTSQESFDKKLEQVYPSISKFWSVEFHTNVENISSATDLVVKIEQQTNDAVTVESYHVSPFDKEVILYITDKTIENRGLEDFLVTILINEVFREEIYQFLSVTSENTGEEGEVSAIMPYSPKFNIVFSLFVENGVEIDWEIEKSLELFKPLLSKLNHFANFSLASQVQYYSKLSKDVKFNEEEKTYVLSQSDLTTFINFGDWNLFTHDINPTINFIIFFPASNYENKRWTIEGSKKNSFLVPQWGGVHIFNKDLPLIDTSKVSITENELTPVLEIFSSQLFQLLGFVKSPKSPSIRIDTLSRVTTFKNLKQTFESLNSLIKVTNSLTEISIPNLTKEYVIKSLEFANETLSVLNNNQDYLKSVTLSSLSLKNSDSAFFEKEMLQQAYFPSEHKYAVFLPLLGPVGSIIFIGVLKMISDIKKERKEKKEKVD
ncbi:glycosyl phosphatidyl inositol 17 [Scheffersomyces coipomensis]|uniref:glycosyl phosphatidyl inositol 17 n=1 Tax=Scheffersomyces coipomensis TaxID=1788519 RepID=UPI00315D59BD